MNTSTNQTSKPLYYGSSLNWHQFTTGDGLPAIDQQMLAECRSKLGTRFLIGGALAAATLGGVVYGRGLLTPNKRFILTSVFTLWGATVGALSASPACLKLISTCPDDSSILRRDLELIRIKHNPNSSLMQTQRRLHLEQQQRDQQRESSSST